jgi:hypothetical protein
MIRMKSISIYDSNENTNHIWFKLINNHIMFTFMCTYLGLNKWKISRKKFVLELSEIAKVLDRKFKILCSVQGLLAICEWLF